MLRDLRIASRALLRSPSFAAATILVLALGIGSSTALFSVVEALLLNPLPYPESNRIVWLWAIDGQQSNGRFAHEDSDEVITRNRSFEAVSSIRFDTFHVRLGGEPERVQGLSSSASFTTVMGTAPFLGRVFLPSDDAGNPRVVLLSYQLWQERFAGDRGVTGRTLLMNGENFAIVGVMPPEFRFPWWAELWATAQPRSAVTSGPAAPSRLARPWNLVARLRPGVSVGQADQDVKRVFAELDREGPIRPGASARVVSLQERLVGDYQGALYGLLGAAALLLLIACANAGNLFMARAWTRRGDWSLRLALGGQVLQLLRPLLAEGLLVGFCGAALGLWAGGWGVRALLLAFPLALPRAWEVGINLRVALFAAGAAVFAATVASIVALLRLSPGRLAESLKDHGRAAGGGRRSEWLSATMVTGQIAFSVVLLSAALLLGNTLEQVMNRNLGIPRENFFLFRMSLPPTKYPQERQRADFFRRVLERISALPGVDAVAASNDPPPGPHDFLESIAVEGQGETGPAEGHRAGMHAVSAGFFQALGIRLIEGREFTERDSADAPRVMVINEKLARRYWPGQSAIGRRIQFRSIPGTPWFEVTGVAEDVRHGGPVADFMQETYVPLAQQTPAHMTYSVHYRTDLAGLLRDIKRELQPLDAEQPVFDVHTFEGYLSLWMSPRRFNTVLMELFGGVAVALAVAGIFSLLAFQVAQRTREIGIRMALGAPPAAVVRLVLGQGMRLVGLGVILGIAAAFALARMVGSFLQIANVADAGAYLTAAATLLGISVAACAIPAWRATRVDPLQALREE